jgi:hypothetical protein
MTVAEKKCERCGAPPPGGFKMLDYCAVCSRDLCPKCMEVGCCGNVPAWSGTEKDDADFAADPDGRNTGGRVYR